MGTRLDVVVNDRDVLGEGPWWSVTDQRLWRVDIIGQKLFSWSPADDTTQQWDFNESLGFAVPTAAGTVVGGFQSALAEATLETTERTPITPTPGNSPARFNDGKTDRSGRVWAGTMVDDQGTRDGVFGHLAGSAFVVDLEEIGISNGLGWSPDNETMYYTDSAVKTIWAFDYDIETAGLSNRRVFVIDDDCDPDGLTVDAEGGVWSAKWDGARVVRYEPNGSISTIIESPVSRPTSLMFGGSALDTLYVTSASVGLSDDEIVSTPAGSVLAVQPGVSGIAEVTAVV